MSTAHRVDLTDVLSTLENAWTTATSLHEKTVPLDATAGGRGSNNASAAEISRELNRLQALLHLAAAETEMEYFRMRGYADPRES